MPEFCYITPDRVLNVSRTGKRTREYRLDLLPQARCQQIAAILNSDRYSKSVELDARDLTVTVYFFRQEPYVVPALFLLDSPVELHLTPAPSFPEAVEEKN